MEEKLISLGGIKKNPGNRSNSRYFVEYLRDLGLVQGVKIPYQTGKRMIYKYSLQEALMNQLVWNFRQKGFDLSKSIDLAKKSPKRREQKPDSNHLSSDFGHDQLQPKIWKKGELVSGSNRCHAPTRYL